MPSFLADYGPSLLANGYDIIPIRPGGKWPNLKGWRTVKVDRKLLDEWIAGRFKRYGVGIRTDYTPAIDIDCYDPAFVAGMVKWCELHVGYGLERQGRAPKTLLTYQTDAPFRKVTSSIWRDKQSREVRLEVLGRGQQFVAHHIHPDTQKPYKWPVTGENLQAVARAKLAIITEAKAREAAAEFDRRAKAAGWTLVKEERLEREPRDGDDDLHVNSEPLDDISAAKLDGMMQDIPNDDLPFDDWRDGVMAIHHQTGGSDRGHDIAFDWSAKSGKHQNWRFDKLWNSCGRNDGDPVTARLLVKWHSEWLKTKEYDIDLQKLDFDQWEKRDLPPPDNLLGEVISTTTRALVIAPTGIGKTKFALAASTAIAGGYDFLDWRSCGRPRRVLYIDGEMSARVFKRRLRDAAIEIGKPVSLHAFNREDFPDTQPLNTEEGQAFIDQLIEKIEEDYGKLDLIVFDNIQALIPGDLKDPEAWQNVLPWARKLTSQAIGQLWVHHTGKNEALGGYGDSTREWQLDVVAQLKRIKVSPFDVAFTLAFTKARERSPDNREDFRPINVYLDNGEWRCETATVTVKLTPSQQAAFDLIPHRGMNFTHWRDACLESDMVTDAEKRDAKRAQFKKAKDALVSKGLVVIRDHRVERSQETGEVFDDISEL